MWVPEEAYAQYNVDTGEIRSWLISQLFFIQGIARTQSPTNINNAPESSTFGKIVQVNLPDVQWTNLAIEKSP